MCVSVVDLMMLVSAAPRLFEESYPYLLDGLYSRRLILNVVSGIVAKYFEVLTHDEHPHPGPSNGSGRNRPLANWSHKPQAETVQHLWDNTPAEGRDELLKTWQARVKETETV